MPYTRRERGPLVAQEIEVRNALRQYSPSTDPLIWTPLAVLYAAYLKHWQACKKYGWRGERINGVQLSVPVDRQPLTRDTFGRAIRRVFPGVQRVHRMTREVLRTSTAVPEPTDVQLEIAPMPVLGNVCGDCGGGVGIIGHYASPPVTA